jgi:trehalose synthase
MNAPERRRPGAAVPITLVPVAPLDLGLLASVLDDDQAAQLMRAAERTRELLSGRVVWNINSTAHGGGVAEMLHSLLAYTLGAGVDTRWIVIGGEPDFFRVTKRLHNRLHGTAGDGGPLGELERAIYAAATAAAAEQVVPLLRPGDIVLLHDPQTAGLVEPVLAAGAIAVWRSHIGIDTPDELARSAAAFLLPSVSRAAAYVFSREAFVWPELEKTRVNVIAPSIDPLATKNQELAPAAVRAILAATALVPGNPPGAPVFHRDDGSPGRVARRAEMIEAAAVPEGASVVAQVSRWDRLKDPLGVIESFVSHISRDPGVHLVLAGPDPAGVADDPEASDVVAACSGRWQSLSPDLRERIHLALLPMADAEENAAVVNALQRWSTVVVQKSLAEGFGLTVAEAMWKSRPVVASRVGGIQDQIVDDDSGLLVDPTDLTAFAEAVSGLLADPARAELMGARAKERVRESFLGARHLEQYADLFERLIRSAAGPTRS